MSRKAPPGTAWCGIHDIYYQLVDGACWYCAQDAQRAGKVGDAPATPSKFAIGWGFGCGICGETGSGPPGSTPQTCRCEREKAIRAVVEQVAAARGISFAEALQLCIRVLEERFPGDEPPPAAARKAVGT